MGSREELGSAASVPESSWTAALAGNNTLRRRLRSLAAGRSKWADKEAVGRSRSKREAAGRSRSKREATAVEDNWRRMESAAVAVAVAMGPTAEAEKVVAVRGCYRGCHKLSTLCIRSGTLIQPINLMMPLLVVLWIQRL
jgi:DhnA family fructose-bisphosphate aldolase class Ia